MDTPDFQFVARSKVRFNGHGYQPGQSQGSEVVEIVKCPHGVAPSATFHHHVEKRTGLQQFDPREVSQAEEPQNDEPTERHHQSTPPDQDGDKAEDSENYGQSLEDEGNFPLA